MTTIRTPHIFSKSINISGLEKNQLQWILLLRILLYTFLLAINYFLSDDGHQIITLPGHLALPLLISIYFVTIGSSFYLQRFCGSLKRFALIQIFIDTILAAFFTYITGCSQSIFQSVLFFPIIAGGLVLTGPRGLLPAASTTLLYGGILFLELFSYIPSYLTNYPIFNEKNISLSINHFSVRGLTFFLVALLSMLFALRLRKTEDALSHSLKDFNNLSDLYRQIFNNISTGIITIDPNRTITSTNQSSQNILGLTSPELLEKNILEILPEIDLTQSNQRRVLSFSHPHGKKLRIGYSQMVLPRPEYEETSGNSHHKIITLQDITEIEHLEAQVRQAEKLAAIGTMSASIAHDFRNPLTAISGSAQILASEFANSKEVEQSNYELCTIILRESNRLINTISDFLKLSRPEIANCQWFSLHHCIKEVLEVCRANPNWPSSCKIDIHIEKNFDIWADQNQLFVILNHLIQNALPFCPTGQEHISITAEEINDIKGNPAVKITLKDNGTGVPSTYAEKIFEPFHTTRPDGTGLGLAIVRQNIAEHKGTVALTTVAPEGAEFVMTFPLPA